MGIRKVLAYRLMAAIGSIVVARHNGMIFVQILETVNCIALDASVTRGGSRVYPSELVATLSSHQTIMFCGVT